MRRRDRREKREEMRREEGERERERERWWSREGVRERRAVSDLPAALEDRRHPSDPSHPEPPTKHSSLNTRHICGALKYYTSRGTSRGSDPNNPNHAPNTSNLFLKGVRFHNVDTPGRPDASPYIY